MRLALCLCKNKCRFIGVSSPCTSSIMSLQVRPGGQNLCGALIRSHGHRPFHDSGFHILKSSEWSACFSTGAFAMAKVVMSTLEMVMAQDRSANDRKVRIGSKESNAGTALTKSNSLIQRLASLDLHRCMLCIKNDAVLIVVYIWRILEEPVTVYR